jgi:hypothetical protein
MTNTGGIDQRAPVMGAGVLGTAQVGLQHGK